jgi:hypothetical protein
MAEGIARSLAPPGIKIWSAGSHPTSVRSEAITVLKQIGIDISGHRSKSVSEIPAYEVDTVITLCSEEECPIFLGMLDGCTGDCRIQLQPSDLKRIAWLHSEMCGTSCFNSSMTFSKVLPCINLASKKGHQAFLSFKA